MFLRIRLKSSVDSLVIKKSLLIDQERARVCYFFQIYPEMPASKISVWWDIENCPVPRNVDPHKIAQNLSSTLHHGNLNGPVTIDAFGDTKVLKEDVLEALSSTGININHVPSGLSLSLFVCVREKNKIKSCVCVCVF